MQVMEAIEGAETLSKNLKTRYSQLSAPVEDQVVPVTPSGTRPPADNIKEVILYL